MNDQKRIQGLIILWAKRSMRINDEVIGLHRENLEEIKRLIADLANASVFNSHRVGTLKKQQLDIEQNLKDARLRRQSIGRATADRIRAFDSTKPTDHEIAQLLGISHIAYQKFLKENPVAKGSLHSSAFMGAETWFEKEVYSGGRSARDNPLYWATWYEFSHLLNTNKEFSAAIGQAFDETFGPLPRYQKAENMDGSVSMVRMPPRLRVVEGGK